MPSLDTSTRMSPPLRPLVCTPTVYGVVTEEMSAVACQRMKMIGTRRSVASPASPWGWPMPSRMSHACTA